MPGPTRAQCRLIDQAYPFQVDLPLPSGGFRKRMDVMLTFIKDRGLGHTMMPGARKKPPDVSTWKFDTREAADAFAAEFGGQRVDVPIR
jgi:hypothetical protein